MAMRKVSRRELLQATGAAGGLLALGVYVPGCQQRPSPGNVGSTGFKPNVFVAFDASGDVTITVSRSEMGQGVRTSLPRIVADELEADLARVSLKQSIGDPIYGDQNTDGSKTVRMMFTPLREAGAAARNLLEQAAADTWGVPIDEVTARNHGVEHGATGRRIEYAELLNAAAEMPLPASLRLKDPAEFRYIGRSATGVDNEAIVTGAAIYGYDFTLPGMKYACVARAPVFDARIRDYDPATGLAVPGVSALCHIPHTAHTPEFVPQEGIAVVADSSWAAIRGRDALVVDWDLGANADYNTADYRRELAESVRSPGTVHRSAGNVEAGLAAEGTLLEATWETAMLAQAPMEPPVATAWVHENGDCEIWGSIQDVQDTQRLVGLWLGIDPSRVRVQATLLGGGFGRKSQTDYVFEAVEASRQAGGPVKLIWTREDDIRHCYYHSEAVQLMRARLGEDGLPTGWLMRAAYPTIDWMFQAGREEPMDWELGMGWTNMPFEVPNFSIEGCRARVPIRIGWLRSVCNVWHAFSINGFVDEMAAAAGEDPVAYRLRLLGKDRTFDAPNEPQDPMESFNGTTVDTGRYRRVLQFLAERTDWGKPLPEGHYRGIAVHNSFYSYTASVVEIAVQPDGSFRIVSVDTAVDCGRIVNPDGVTAQVEGATIYGLSIALHGELTASEGRVQQSNFSDYRILRIHEIPGIIRAHLVESDAPPSGIGEPPTPVIAPALASALHAASGRRYRRLPLLADWNASRGQ
ncbi:MAG: molybdopterin-dependent oxidoreductase [Gammaproteobacteria bacterium]|nr:molybdopterin-dependent oxidoreductase [Gammaproteobacteria bacterium]MDH4254809.1 molybdopterin-dependent oxidoreductase [Gammaproteobacteria bacterium]MDH5309857.1 molybdopterin-dependent oxidoreductase [Gammaproteobacteria bacterium]